ncbi:hypothetical protein D3C72_1503030 [compost metagenome]
MTKSRVTNRRRPAIAVGRLSSVSPLRTASKAAQQATERASGPAESSEVDNGTAPSNGTRRALGLKPVSPQNALGMRIEPPVSVPSAATAMPSATLTAPPEVEPPAMQASSNGVRGVP